MDPSTTFCPNPACPDKGRQGRGNIDLPEDLRGDAGDGALPAAPPGGADGAGGDAAMPRRPDAGARGRLRPRRAHGGGVAASGRRPRRAGAYGGGGDRAGRTGPGAGRRDRREGAPGAPLASHGGVCPVAAVAGGDLSPARDGALVTATLRRVAACAARAALLIYVDSFAAYVGAVRTVCRVARRTGRPGRPRLVLPETVLLAQVVKSHQGRRLVDVTRRVVWGTAEAVADASAATRGGTQINTSYIERLNATFRAALAPLTRRGRRLAHGTALLTSGMGPRRGGRRHGLQRLLAPREPPPPCPGGTHMAGAHPGHGRRPDRPGLDHGGFVALPRPPSGGRAFATSDGRQRPGTHRATGARQSPPHGGRRMTTLSWGATGGCDHRGELVTPAARSRASRSFPMNALWRTSLSQQRLAC